VPFFLSSVVQSPDLEDQTLSGSQALPPIDDTDISFDDTVAGDFFEPDETDQTFANFDDSIEISEDDISLELGDLMPIDLDQLDIPGVSDEELTLDSTEVLPSDDKEASLEDIDLDLGEDLADQSSEFDATEILSTDTFDEDINLDITGDFDQSVDLDLSGDFDAIELDDTTISSEPSDETEVLGLDGSLFDEMSEKQPGSDTDFEEGLTDFELDETDIFLESEAESEEQEDAEKLGDELFATMNEELELDFSELETGQDQEENDSIGGDEPLLSMDEELELNLAEHDSEIDEEGDFEPASSPSLGLGEIDVSDLISSPEQHGDVASSPDNDAELDLASLVEEENEKGGVDLELLDDSIPEIEIIEEEDNEGPPDLP